MQAQTITQIRQAPQESLWHFLAQLPASMEAQVLYGLLLAGLIGMLSHYLMKWLQGEIRGNLFQYLFRMYPRRTLLAVATLLGTCLTAIAANVFVTSTGEFVGWLNVLWSGLTTGYAVDSIANKGKQQSGDGPDDAGTS